MMLTTRFKRCLKDKREWKKGLLAFALTFLFFTFVSHHVKFLISETDSLPYHYFLQLPNIKPRLYDCTVIESNWYHGKVIKRIMGLSGDLIYVNPKTQVFVRNIKLGKAFSKDSKGRVLTPTQTQIIPLNHVFLATQHPRSFDSRYQELGLVPVSALQGWVIPLW